MKMGSEDARKKRHARIRRRLSGVPERPRMCVYRSDRQIYAQIIDDTTGKVLVSASSLSKEFKAQGLKGSGVPAAKARRSRWKRYGASTPPWSRCWDSEHRAPRPATAAADSAPPADSPAERPAQRRDFPYASRSIAMTPRR